MTVESETSPQPSVVLGDPAAMDSFDSSAMSPQDMRMLLGRLGYTPPVEMTPQDMEAATALFNEIPQGVMAAALNPGMGVSFNADAAGIVSLGAEVTMSEVQTGPGFEQTQSFNLSTKREVPLGLDVLGQSMASKYALLPEPMRERVAEWGISFDDGGVQVDLGVGSVGISGASGERLTYQAAVPPDIGQRIAAGDLSVAPDPTNPMAMPVGSSVVIRGEAFESTTYEASWRMIHGSDTITEFEGQGFGIKRIDERVFEVTQGPIAAVESDFFLGIGSSEINVGLVKDRQFEDETLSIARMDLSTPEGQQAYREFMQTGTVPNQTGPGVLRAGQSERLSIDEQSGVEINLGPVSAEFVADTTYESSVTHWNDGSGEDRVSGNALGAGFDVSSTISPDGSVDESSRRWTVTYDDLSAESAQMMQMAFSTDGNGQEMPETTHTEMRFTNSELMQIRDRARDYLSETNPNYLAAIDAGTTVPPTSYIPRLAAAQTPEEVYRSGFIDPLDNSEVALGLVTLRTHGDDDVVPPPLAGELELRDESMGLLFEKTRPELPPVVSTEAPVMPVPPTGDVVPPVVPPMSAIPPVVSTEAPVMPVPSTGDVVPPVVPPMSAIPPVVSTEAPVMPVPPVSVPPVVADQAPVVPPTSAIPPVVSTEAPVMPVPPTGDVVPPVVPPTSVIPPVVSTEAPVMPVPPVSVPPVAADQAPAVPPTSAIPPVVSTEAPVMPVPPTGDVVPPVVPPLSAIPPVVSTEAPVMPVPPTSDVVPPVVPPTSAIPPVVSTEAPVMPVPIGDVVPPVVPPTSAIPPVVSTEAPVMPVPTGDVVPPVVDGVRPSFPGGGLPPAADSTPPSVQPPVVDGVRPSFPGGGLPAAADSTPPSVLPPVVDGVRPSFPGGGLPAAADSAPPSVQPPAFDLADGVLKSGDEGVGVLGVQTALNNLGYSVPTDMKFETETDLAVRDFQGNQGLKVDGIVGPNTFEALTEANRERELGQGASDTFQPSTNLDVQDGLIRKREEGIGVLGTQAALNDLGYNIAADMKFGPETDGAVRDFQATQGLNVDGIVGPLTSASLVEANREREHATSRGTVDESANRGAVAASPAVHGSVPAHVPADPRLLGDPDHDNYMRATAAVHRLDASMGRTPDAASERLVASATGLARENGMRIDHLMLSSGNGRAAKGEHLIIVEGELEDPGHRKASMPTQTAVSTSVEDTFASLERVRQQEIARQKESAVAIAPEQDARAPVAPRM